MSRPLRSGASRVLRLRMLQAALRLASSPGSLVSYNCELKCFDATANPYLGLAALVTAGMSGIRRGLKLPAPARVDPGKLAEQEREKLGIRRLPADLGEALAAMQSDTAFREALDQALGATLVRAFLAVRQAEWEALGRMSIQEEAAALYMRY
ncbi:hypothetical protein N2152v2_006673 [Parachlorella kessleri]